MIRFTMLTLVVALGACGDNDNVQPDASVVIDGDPSIDAAPPREVFMLIQPLQAGEIVEGIMAGGVNDRAIIRLTAPVSELDWNIHAHPGGSTVTVFEELNKMTVVYDFVPTEQTDWFLLLRNSGPANMDVDVKIELYGAMTFAFI